jgi:hypothetical protein
MVWYYVVLYGVVWCGMVWYGMVWYGMVWYGIVWYGMEKYEYGFSDMNMDSLSFVMPHMVVNVLLSN